jgi:hypothetical protein
MGMTIILPTTTPIIVGVESKLLVLDDTLLIELEERLQPNIILVKKTRCDVCEDKSFGARAGTKQAKRP